MTERRRPRAKHSQRTDIHELVKIHNPLVVRINLVDHLHDLRLFHLEAEGPHEHLELVQIDRALFLGIEKIERLPQLLLLVVREVRARSSLAAVGCEAVGSLLSEPARRGIRAMSVGSAISGLAARSQSAHGQRPGVLPPTCSRSSKNAQDPGSLFP